MTNPLQSPEEMHTSYPKRDSQVLLYSLCAIIGFIIPYIFIDTKNEIRIRNLGYPLPGGAIPLEDFIFCPIIALISAILLPPLWRLFTKQKSVSI